MKTMTRTTRRQSPCGMHSAGRFRPIIIELAPPFDTIGFRLKQTRAVYRLPVDYLYREALKAEIERVKIEKRKARIAKRKEARGA
jgi:hypothetical protein